MCDCGFTQVLTDVVGKDAVNQFNSVGANRCHALELVVGDEADVTLPGDVLAFGMWIQELLTLRPPYSNRKHDVAVVQDVQERWLYSRPVASEAMTDALWSTVHDRCWAFHPEDRPMASKLSPCLGSVSASLNQQMAEA